MADSPPVLSCASLRKTFPGVVALDDVSFALHRGSIHALVGENGAGKSTLVKILAGAHHPDSGSIHIDGRAVAISNARSAQRLGIGIVYQEHNLVNELPVSENIYLGRWPRSGLPGVVDFGQLNSQAAALLDALQVDLPLRRPVRVLSVAQQQMVEIAKAFSLDARILILDEPSAVLTPHELERLFQLLRDLKQRGVAVIYISHRLDEIFELADCVTVLRDGRYIFTKPIREVARGDLITAMVGRELKDEFPDRHCDIGEAVLTVDRLSVARRFAEVSFSVGGGEVFALTGLVGSGRSSVLKTIFGAVPATGGTVSVGGIAGPFRHPREAIRSGVAYLPEDRKQEGLLLQRSVRENTTLANLRAYLSALLLSRQQETRHTLELMAKLSIKAPGPESRMDTLSGGNQQKVLLARWMDRPFQVILFDEPTRGVDVGAKYEIYVLLNQLAARGLAVVMVSSELPEVIGMADRIGVMHEGRLMGILDNAHRQSSQSQIMALASGGDAVHA